MPQYSSTLERKEYMEVYMKKYNENNKEKIKEYQKKWRAENKEYMKEYLRIYREQKKRRIRKLLLWNIFKLVLCFNYYFL